MILEREVIQVFDQEEENQVYGNEDGPCIALALAMLHMLLVDYSANRIVSSRKKKPAIDRESLEEWFYTEDFYEFYWFVNNALQIKGRGFNSATDFVEFVRRHDNKEFVRRIRGHVRS